MATVHFQAKFDRQLQWLALMPLSKKVPGFESPPYLGLFYVNPRGFSPVAQGSSHKPRHAFGGKVKRREGKRERDGPLAFLHWHLERTDVSWMWASAPSSGDPAHSEEVETKWMGSRKHTTTVGAALPSASSRLITFTLISGDMRAEH